MVKSLFGSKFYVCATEQNADLNQAGFEALTWVEVGDVGKLGEMGTSQNLPSYSTMATRVTQKSKGEADAGNPTIECARAYADAGQVIMNTIADPTDLNAYAFKWELNDGSSSLTNTIRYSRGLCTGPTHPMGGNEDFDIDIFTLGLVQREVVVNPTAI